LVLHRHHTLKQRHFVFDQLFFDLVHLAVELFLHGEHVAHLAFVLVVLNFGEQLHVEFEFVDQVVVDLLHAALRLVELGQHGRTQILGPVLDRLDVGVDFGGPLFVLLGHLGLELGEERQVFGVFVEFDFVLVEQRGQEVLEVVVHLLQVRGHLLALVTLGLLLLEVFLEVAH